MPGGHMESKTAGKLSPSEEVLHQCSGPLSSDPDTPIRTHPRTSILLEISLASSFQQLQLLRRGKWRKKNKKTVPTPPAHHCWSSVMHSQDNWQLTTALVHGCVVTGKTGHPDKETKWEKGLGEGPPTFNTAIAQQP